MKKGSSLIAEIIALLVMIGMGYLLGGIMIYVQGIAGLPYMPKVQYELTLEPGAIPIRHEDAMLSLMESTYEGVTIKQLAFYAVAERNVDPYIPDKGKTINLKNAIENNLHIANWGADMFLLKLKTPDSEIPLIWDDSLLSRSKVLRVQRVSVPMDLGSLGKGSMELYVVG